jgi:hypothetical protein
LKGFASVSEVAHPIAHGDSIKIVIRKRQLMGIGYEGMPSDWRARSAALFCISEHLGNEIYEIDLLERGELLSSYPSKVSSSRR